MNPYAVLAAAAARWDRLAVVLDSEPGLRAELAALLGRVREAEERAEDATASRPFAEQAARLLLERCPDGIGPAGAGAARFTDTGGAQETVEGFTAADLAVLVLDRNRMVGPVLGPVRERLLAAPALPAETVRRHGGDPDMPGLIRLDGPGGAKRLPTFQFSRGVLPREIVLEVNEMLHADGDPWGAADWWLSENAWIGVSPAELLGTGRDRELADVAGRLVEGD